MSDERDNATVIQARNIPTQIHSNSNTPLHQGKLIHGTPSKQGGQVHLLADGLSMHSMNSMGGVNSATPAKSVGGGTTTTITEGEGAGVTGTPGRLVSERQHSSVSGYDDSIACELNNGGGGPANQDWPRSPYSGRKHLAQGDKNKIGHRRVDEKGEVTYKKIQSSQIMGSIQLGIHTSVGGLANRAERDLLMKDFMEVEILNMDRGGSATTPAHKFSDFKFKVYAPIAFRYFRELFNIKPEVFLMSLTSESLIELTNPGASGSMFFLSADDEFIIKTVQHKEAEFLLKLLPGYYMNLNQNPRTLLPKFFGMYSYLCLGKNVRLIVMNNLLPSSIKMHQKYDLKGSTYKRKASKAECEKSTPTYKDLDFLEHHTDGLLLEAETYNALVKTIQRDCRVLESFKIMDYSLLVGVYNLDQAKRDREEARRSQLAAIGEEAASVAAGASSSNQNAPSSPRHKYIVSDNSVDVDGDLPSTDSLGDRPGVSQRRMSGSGTGAKNLTRSRSINRPRLAAYATVMESIQADMEPLDEEDDVPPGGIPARNAKGERLYIYLGIIDILQSYRLKKKLEHTFKSMFHDGDTISVHRPAFYAQRFMDFMANKVFKKIPSPNSAQTPVISLSHHLNRFDRKYVPVLPVSKVQIPGSVQVTSFNTQHSAKMTPIIGYHHTGTGTISKSASRMSSSTTTGYGTTGTGTNMSYETSRTGTNSSGSSSEDSNSSLAAGGHTESTTRSSLTVVDGPASGLVTSSFTPLPETPQRHKVVIDPGVERSRPISPTSSSPSSARGLGNINMESKSERQLSDKSLEAQQDDETDGDRRATSSSRVEAYTAGEELVAEEIIVQESSAPSTPSIVGGEEPSRSNILSQRL